MMYVTCHTSMGVSWYVFMACIHDFSLPWTHAMMTVFGHGFFHIFVRMIGCRVMCYDFMGSKSIITLCCSSLYSYRSSNHLFLNH